MMQTGQEGHGGNLATPPEEVYSAAAWQKTQRRAKLAAWKPTAKPVLDADLTGYLPYVGTGLMIYNLAVIKWQRPWGIETHRILGYPDQEQGVAFGKRYFPCDYGTVIGLGILSGSTLQTAIAAIGRDCL